MTTTHPAPTCLHCAALRRRLDHVEAELAIACWTLKALCERLDQHRLAAMVAALDAFAESEAESEEDAEDADGGTA